MKWGCFWPSIWKTKRKMVLIIIGSILSSEQSSSSKVLATQDIEQNLGGKKGCLVLRTLCLEEWRSGPCTTMVPASQHVNTRSFDEQCHCIPNKTQTIHSGFPKGPHFIYSFWVLNHEFGVTSQWIYKPPRYIIKGQIKGKIHVFKIVLLSCDWHTLKFTHF